MPQKKSDTTRKKTTMKAMPKKSAKSMPNNAAKKAAKAVTAKGKKGGYRFSL
ncbi:MAG: hypothetical protein ACREHG_09905 [Candidatus Saccharimonadales bacterium]